MSTTTNFQAICVRCGLMKNATNAVDDGWQLYPTRHGGAVVNALCWRCEREQRAAAMTAVSHDA